MKNKLIVIKYWSNPNLPYEYNHKGELDSLTEIDHRTFIELLRAISFLRDCSHSLTKEEDLTGSKIHIQNEISEKIEERNSQQEELSSEYSFWDNHAEIF